MPEEPPTPAEDVEDGSLWYQVLKLAKKPRIRLRTKVEAMDTPVTVPLARGVGALGPEAACPPKGTTAQPQPQPQPPKKSRWSSLWPAWPPDTVVGPTEFPSMVPLTDMLVKYELIEKLGQGSFGSVFKAQGPSGEVAVKVAVEPLSLAEAHLQSSCQSKHVCAVLDAWLSPFYCIYVFPVLSLTLHHFLNKRGVLDDEVVVDLCLQLAEAIEMCHRRKVLHRDIHTANIMVVEEQPLLLQLIDFGRAARLPLLPQDRQNTSMYDVRVRCPELLLTGEYKPKVGWIHNKGKVKYGRPADVWAMAGVMFIISTGAGPYARQDEHGELQCAVAMLKSLGRPDLIFAAASGWAFLEQEEVWRPLVASSAHEKPDFAALPELLRGPLSETLRYNPDKRLSAAAFLRAAAR